MNATGLDPAALFGALHAALDLDPSDAATRLMLADLLQDADDRVAARGQRWQSLHAKWPVATGRPDGSCRWWLAADGGFGRDPDDLPAGAFDALTGGPGDPRFARFYPTRRAAEADLAQALEALARKEAVSAGYDGEPCPWCGLHRVMFRGRRRLCDGCGKGWVV
jgi:hypothetical protein